MKAFVIILLSVIHSSYSSDCTSKGTDQGAGHFTYDEKDEWSKLFAPACDGTAQSPIDIITNDAKKQTYSTPLDLSGYNIKLQQEHLINNGHTAQVTEKIAIEIRGGPAGPDTFVLKQFHFHFGKKNTEGSEHQFDGAPTAMEIHFVHMNKNYDSIETAQEKKDGLLVIGVLAIVDKAANPALGTIANALNKVKSADTESDITSAITLADLLPDNQNVASYYTYNGSLTTPRCFESVIWVVAKNTIGVGDSQLKSFRSLKEECGKPIAGNFRSVQALNKRVVSVVSA